MTVGLVIGFVFGVLAAVCGWLMWDEWTSRAAHRAFEGRVQRLSDSEERTAQLEFLLLAIEEVAESHTRTCDENMHTIRMLLDTRRPASEWIAEQS